MTADVALEAGELTYGLLPHHSYRAFSAPHVLAFQTAGNRARLRLAAMERTGPGSPPSAMEFPSPMPNISHYCNGIQSPNRPLI